MLHAKETGISSSRLGLWFHVHLYLLPSTGRIKGLIVNYLDIVVCVILVDRHCDTFMHSIHRIFTEHVRLKINIKCHYDIWEARMALACVEGVKKERGRERGISARKRAWEGGHRDTCKDTIVFSKPPPNRPFARWRRFTNTTRILSSFHI